MAAALLSLVACGGGGGGDGGNGFKTNDALIVTPQNVSVSTTLSDPAPTGTFYVNASGLNPGQQVYVSVQPTTHGIATVSQTHPFLPVTVTIQFQSPYALGVGTYNDRVQVSMCFDQACTQPLNGSPYTLQVDYTVGKSQLPAPTIGSISPATVAAGGSSFMLTVLGNGFSVYSTVQWNGGELKTTYVSAKEIVAQVPAAYISATGSATVTVTDPTNSNATSSAPQTINMVAASKDAVAFQNNSAHTGAVTFANVNFPSSAKWSVDVGGTPSYAIVAQGMVIVTISSAGGAKLLALDQATGGMVWGPIALSNDSNAVYDAGRVYVLSTEIGSTGTLQAFDVSSGALDWSTTLSGQSSFNAAPTAAGGVVYAAGVGMGGTLYAVDESTGTLKWTQTINAGDNGAPAVTVDGVYMTAPCQAYDIRPATGEVIWQKNTGCGGGGGATAVVANQLLYAPMDFGTQSQSGYVFNAETGDSAGLYDVDAPAAFTSTFGYFMKSGTLSGVSVADDKTHWTFTGDGRLQGSPIAVDQYVFIGSGSGNVYAVDSTTGLQAWSVNAGAGIDTNVAWMQLTGLSAGDGLLIVPAGTKVVAFTLSVNP